MAEITASLVKELRDKTGAGMMDCKAALQETGGDMEAAVDWLRAKGLSKAAKKAGRVAAEGLIGLSSEPKRGALVEVNSETDFVARNPQFQHMVITVASLALECDGDLSALENYTYPGRSISVVDHIKEMVGTIGENLTLRRTTAISVGNGVVGTYLHNAIAPNLGKIGVIVGLESKGDAAKLDAFGRQLAMHIAAAAPAAVSVADLDPSLIERERAVLTEQAKESGKPDAVIAKMVEGRLRKYHEEVVLLEQVFVIDGETKVGDAVKAAEMEVGAPIKVTGFARYALGEGIERDKTDFAAEVAAAAGA